MNEYMVRYLGGEGSVVLSAEGVYTDVVGGIPVYKFYKTNSLLSSKPCREVTAIINMCHVLGIIKK